MRYVGEAVAIVVAETVAAAKDGAERIAVDYEQLPAVTDAVAAAPRGAPRDVGRRRSNVCIDAVVGDPPRTEAAFAQGAHVVRLETLVQRVTGVPMEPRAAVADLRSRERPLHALRRQRRRRCARRTTSPACSTCRPSACAW